MSPENEQTITNRRLDQLVELAAQGLTDKEIAQRLGISHNTVQTYWKRLRERLQVRSRTAVVLAALRTGIEERNQQLRAANEALQKTHQSSHEGMAALLADVQKRLAEAQRAESEAAFFQKASMLGKVVAYELESISPVLHRYLSRSAITFGIDVAALQNAGITFYDIVYADDLPLIYEKSLGASYAPNERYVFLYRLKMPEPRWILDTHQAVYNDRGEMSGVVGIAMDIHDLVLAGLLRPEVSRIVLTSDM